jgi:hypothetical protein
MAIRILASAIPAALTQCLNDALAELYRSGGASGIEEKWNLATMTDYLVSQAEGLPRWPAAIKGLSEDKVLNFVREFILENTPQVRERGFYIQAYSLFHIDAVGVKPHILALGKHYAKCGTLAELAKYIYEHGDITIGEPLVHEAVRRAAEAVDHMSFRRTQEPHVQDLLKRIGPDAVKVLQQVAIEGGTGPLQDHEAALRMVASLK